MAAQPRPTDEALIDAARAHVSRLYGPAKAPRAITLHIDGVPDPLVLPCPAPGPVTIAVSSAEPWVPTDAQACILEALAGIALRTDALAAKAGINRSQLFAHPGGLKELQERGDVSHHRRLGFYRPDAPPEQLAHN